MLGVPPSPSPSSRLFSFHGSTLGALNWEPPGFVLCLPLWVIVVLTFPAGKVPIPRPPNASVRRVIPKAKGARPPRVPSQPCSTRIVRLLEKNMEVVIGIAFAIAILLVRTQAHGIANPTFSPARGQSRRLLAETPGQRDARRKTLLRVCPQIAGMVFSMILYCQITKRDGATTA